jgi:hypothetical protein
MQAGWYGAHQHEDIDKPYSDKFVPGGGGGALQLCGPGVCMCCVAPACSLLLFCGVCAVGCSACSLLLFCGGVFGGGACCKLFVNLPLRHIPCVLPTIVHSSVSQVVEFSTAVKTPP